MSKMMTQENLNKLVCMDCECDSSTVWFHSKCHPNAATWTRYHKDGFISVHCSVCSKEIVKVEVAEDERPKPARSEDMAMLIHRLCYVISKHEPNNETQTKALDYLHRHGLGGSPLKGETE